MPTSGQVYPNSKTSPGKIQSNCFVVLKEQTPQSKVRAEKSRAEEKAREKMIVIKFLHHSRAGKVQNRCKGQSHSLTYGFGGYRRI